MKLHPQRAHLAALFVAAVGALFGACSDDDEGPVDGDGTFTGTIHIQDNRFSPANATITAGDSVTWSWDGNDSHTVTHGSSPTVPPDAQKLFDVPERSSGTFGYRFDTAGSYPYFCRPHFNMGMRGTITVVP